MTGTAIAAKLGLARSTVSRWLRRAGMGRLAQIDPPEPVRRYQRERPGELIHLDIKKLGRFDHPGHRVTGDRRGRNRGAGWDFVHVAVDDATRLAYVEVLGDERETTTTGFLLRALRWFRDQGIKTERVMTDNGSAYRSGRFAKALRLLAIRHIFTRPYTPKTNGKAERFIQTLLREWAYGLAHPSSNARNTDLPRWLDWFNQSRPHSALKGLSPGKRVNNLLRLHIYVTHHQVEAMTMADRIVVLNGGRIEQFGTPMLLYQHPATRFVATFIGQPNMNLVPATVKGRDSAGLAVELPSGTVMVLPVEAGAAKPGDRVEVGIRPENVDLGQGLSMRIRVLERLGGVSITYGEIGGTRFCATLPGDSPSERRG